MIALCKQSASTFKYSESILISLAGSNDIRGLPDCPGVTRRLMQPGTRKTQRSDGFANSHGWALPGYCGTSRRHLTRLSSTRESGVVLSPPTPRCITACRWKNSSRYWRSMRSMD